MVLRSAAIALFVGLAAGAACSSGSLRVEDGWVGETRGMLSAMRAEGKIGVDSIISLGTPAYAHLRGRVSEESSYALTFFAEGLPKIIAGTLSKAVPFGGVRLEFDDLRSSGLAAEMIAEASGFLPTRWLERIARLNRGRKLVVGIASRGQYRSGRIMTNNLKTSFHELVHAYEGDPPKHLENKLRSEFYERKTSGKGAKKLRKLSRITNLYFYGHEEKFRAGFVCNYIGKERGVELMSMGLECLMWNRYNIWNRDPEMTKFLLGMMIFFGESGELNGEFVQ